MIASLSYTADVKLKTTSKDIGCKRVGLAYGSTLLKFTGNYNIVKWLRFSAVF